MNEHDAISGFGVDLYWLPLGAGGWFVRFNGRVYEALVARREHRRPLDLYHCALEVRVPEGRHVIEVSWPIPAHAAAHGVVREGAVLSRALGRSRVFRYEVRCWLDGVIPDVAAAVASPQLVSDEPDAARGVLELVTAVPTPVWGRDELGAGEMWNSNSVISWLLERNGLVTDAVHPPVGGRAPGWESGLLAAHGHRPPLVQRRARRGMWWFGKAGRTGR